MARQPSLRRCPCLLGTIKTMSYKKANHFFCQRRRGQMDQWSCTNSFRESLNLSGQIRSQNLALNWQSSACQHLIHSPSWQLQQPTVVRNLKWVWYWSGVVVCWPTTIRYEWIMTTLLLLPFIGQGIMPKSRLSALSVSNWWNKVMAYHDQEPIMKPKNTLVLS